jgi:hypothetical protein
MCTLNFLNKYYFIATLAATAFTVSITAFAVSLAVLSVVALTPSAGFSAAAAALISCAKFVFIA